MLRTFLILVCSLWLVCAAAAAVAQSDAVLRAQERLDALGLSPGPVDGAMGSKTRAAISAFQRRNSLPVTGELDAATQAALTGGLRRAPPPAPVTVPPAVPVPEVTMAPLPRPGTAEPRPTRAGAAASIAPTPAVSAATPPPASASSAPPASTASRIYLAVAAAGLALFWWLRRRSRAVARAAGANRAPWTR